jgi:DNA excision repair protein ERCC-5
MVECYSSARIEEKLGVAKNDLVALAMLLGCDYTMGVHGVGIVNGLEVVQAFKPQPQQGTLDGSCEAEDWLRNLRHLQTWAQNVAEWGEESAGVQSSDSKTIAAFKRSHRNFRTQWTFPSDFPSSEVQTAFFRPVVDRSREPFSWGTVDDDRVVAQLSVATGLDEDKIRERLDPALHRYRDTLRQPRITEYMVPTGVGEVAIVRSHRMRDTLRRLRGEGDDSPDRTASPPQKRKRGQKLTGWKLRPCMETTIELDDDL